METATGSENTKLPQPDESIHSLTIYSRTQSASHIGAEQKQGIKYFFKSTSSKVLDRLSSSFKNLMISSVKKIRRSKSASLEFIDLI